MKVRFSSPALAELDTIFAYIHQYNPVAAGKVVMRIQAVAAQLARYPSLGPPKYKAGVRMFPVRGYPYLIFYTIENEEVLVLSVRHSARKPMEE